MKYLKSRRGKSSRTHRRRVKDVLDFYKNSNVIISEINNDTSNQNNPTIISEEIIEPDVVVQPYIDNIAEFNHLENISDIEIDVVNKFNEEISDNGDNRSLREDLKIWSMETKVTNSSIDYLLKILRKHGHDNLPGCARTLKETPRNIATRKMGTGKFWYFGVIAMIELLKQENVTFGKKLTIKTNIDGVPLFGSSKGVFWPILGSFLEMKLKPFVIAIYYDENGSKPVDVHDFFQEYIDEMSYLLIFGFEETTIECGNFSLDAPALAFVKNTKGHNCIKGCQKCEVKGKRLYGRTCFLKTDNLILRTDFKFRTHDDLQHHQSNESSPLEKLPIDMILNFNLDWLHVCLLGVTKKKLKILTKSFKKFPMLPTLKVKLRKTDFDAIKKVTNYAGITKPIEINRKIRSLDFLAVMKGTEFRSFILYYGIVALKENIDSEIYMNYLTFHIGLTICLSKEHNHLLPVAKVCFEKFVKDFKKLYGSCLVSYNVHNLLHLVDDVEKWGPLDDCSTFPFENTLGILKSLPNSGHLPLEQTISRYLETIQHNIHSFKENEAKKGKI